MVYYTRNKNELLVLVGAIYSFIAYLTAFILEILFIIDLAKRSSNLMATTFNNNNNPSSITSTTTVSQQTTANINNNGDSHTQIINEDFNTFDQQARLALETMQTHITISCLAISILYFIIFVASLILIVSIILRSTFFLLIWMCTMATMFLPEFCLIIYVSIYGWGLKTRNGQIELLFYFIRAILNVIFIYRAYRLYKNWNYEKNFFILKSSSLSKVSSSFNHSRFNSITGYDSPYFIQGDSLTTTINPVFSSSTLNLDRYDAIRDFNSPINRSTTTKTTIMNNDNNSNNFFDDYHIKDNNTLTFQNRIRNVNVNSMYSNNNLPSSSLINTNSSRFNNNNNYQFSFDDHHQISANDKNNFSYHANTNTNANEMNSRNIKLHDKLTNSNQNNNRFNRLYQMRPSSVLSINDNDNFSDCEMDLDYRTLTNQRHYDSQQNEQASPATVQGRGRYQETSNNNYNNRGPINAGISYSTQSLDRRHLHDMEFNLPEQVILKPLGHQPFEYLHRLGSSSQISNINHQAHLPSTKTITSRKERDNFNDDRFS